jgi:hypothetical protein
MPSTFLGHIIAGLNFHFVHSAALKVGENAALRCSNEGFARNSKFREGKINLGQD